ncbi:protein HflC [Terrihabitans soli]|uniref:Protein HflC n=1 Tax=Terrihabitans soli TaxID=708113 RepID=A0A6S6QLU2_9HYPH|nr:protease modulator HflC [Terrihabitans soli]BCJ91384.1 protein HflC [Terrihabitans soli]
MKGLAGGIAAILLAVAAYIGFSSVFTVSQTDQALVLRFGQLIKIVQEPGLNFKLPFIDTVVRIDKRILALDLAEKEVVAADQKRLIVDAFARYRIINPLLFYQSLKTVEIANNQLDNFLESALRNYVGASTFQNVVRDRRSELMAQIKEEVNQKAKERGIEIVDVRIRRADLPDANSQAVYTRMQTALQREAAEFRAQGQEAAQRIRAKADRDVVVILAEANRDAERVRGEGDGTRNGIFAEAYSQDKDFFSFYRSMQAYEQSLVGDTRLVLSPDSEFFRYFRFPSGAPPAKASGQ